MSSLSNGLPRQTEDPTTKAFKEAALSLTNLYKAAQASRREGYRDAIDDLYSLFIKDKSEVDLARLAVWIDERRRKVTTTETPLRSEQTDHHLATDVDLMDNASVMMISPSPVTRARGIEGRTERRDRERKRRGGGDVVTDLHKRGRYDRA